MSPNMGTSKNKIACANNGQKLNSAFHTLFKVVSPVPASHVSITLQAAAIPPAGHLSPTSQSSIHA
ncbi:hypothetical protein E2C01_044020 [Portunus trituberculatus]|uniref:Uncharacterized protein n=1 Tax=Portunus trituberculatus TaxID=210409 RepID=A0A5B7FZ98_PORTR|nr:hypothetical protein [Portunus trituberculatus]